jgi:hypothetical protein
VHRRFDADDPWVAPVYGVVLPPLELPYVVYGVLNRLFANSASLNRSSAVLMPMRALTSQ